MSMESSEKPAKPVRRFGVGLLTVVQILCVGALLLAVNYLGSQHATTKDLSGDAAFTLSSATINYLKSPAIQNRKDEDQITILIAFKSNVPFAERTRGLGEEYARLSNGKIKVRPMDPIRAVDEAERNISEYGSFFKAGFNRTIFTRDLIVVDARTAEEKKAPAGKESERGAAHIRFIEPDMTVQYGQDEHNARKINAFLGEAAISTALIKAVEGTPRKLYYIADKSSLAEGGTGTAWGNFSDVMQSRNLLPERLNIAGLNEIPKDAAAVAVVGPVYDFSPEEINVLREYWSRPRAALLVTVSAAETPPQFRAFLRDYGVTPRRDRVVRAKGSDISTAVIGKFTEGMSFTRDFWNRDALFEGSTCSLEVRDKGADDLNMKKIMPYVLMESEKATSWGETEFDKGNPKFDPQTDTAGPVALAAAVIRGGATNDQVSDDIGRMVVLSNSDFLEPTKFTDIQRDFLASSMDWMIGREQMVGIGPRSFGTYKLPLLDSQISFINRVNLMFLPAFALLAGAIMWSSRRA